MVEIIFVLLLIAIKIQEGTYMSLLKAEELPNARGPAACALLAARSGCDQGPAGQ